MQRTQVTECRYVDASRDEAVLKEMFVYQTSTPESEKIIKFTNFTIYNIYSIIFFKYYTACLLNI